MASSISPQQRVITSRSTICGSVMRPPKTRIVYCKDVNRRGDHPDIHFDFLGYQFRARKTMRVKPDRRIFAHSFLPAASPKALTRISREIRHWALHHRSDKSLSDLAAMYNPCIGAGSTITATSIRRSCVQP